MRNDNAPSPYLNNYFNDEPVLFLDKIKVYPVKVKQLFEFNEAIQCLSFDPLDYEDVAVGSLPRLYFLTEWLRPHNKQWQQKNIVLAKFFNLLELLLCLVLDEDYRIVFVDSNGTGYYMLRIYISPTECVDITPAKFEQLRKLILEQNGCVFSDDFIHNDIKQFIKEQSKNNSDGMTLEDVRDAFMVSMRLTDIHVLDEMSIRRYNRMSAMLFNKDDYMMAKQAELTGFVSFKTPIKHWTVIDNKPHNLEKYLKIV